MGGLKITIWLHQSADQIAATALLANLAELASKAAAQDSDRWHTLSDPAGGYQISVAHAREFSELARRRIDLPDIPAHPIMRIAMETKYFGEAIDPVRLKYVLSLRSDELPNGARISDDVC